MSRPTSRVSELDAIAALFQPYLDGARSGQSNDMKAVFHDDATIFGYAGDDLFAGPIQQFFDWNEANGPATGLEAHIASIDLAGSVASVRIELDDWTGLCFTDLFTLLKFDGAWRITNKVFHLHPPKDAVRGEIEWT